MGNRKNGTKFTLSHITNQITLSSFVLLLLTFSVRSEVLKSEIVIETCAEQDDKKMKVNVSDLPAGISEDIIRNYPGAEISEAWKWIDETGKVEKYEVKIHNEGKDFYVNYSEDGNAIKIEE